MIKDHSADAESLESIGPHNEEEIMNTQPADSFSSLIAFDDPPLSHGVAGLDLMQLAEPSAAAAPTPAPVPVEPAGAAPLPFPGSDFVRFYALRENPFSDSVNAAYFYKTDSHDEALQRMLLAIEHRISMGMVTGPSGMGKTLVTQLLLQQVDPARHHAILVLVSPGLSRTSLLREILSELNIAVPDGIVRAHDLLKLLSNFIIDLHEQGQRLVILIDECHFLSSDCLHLVRTISNIEIPECKLTTCLLFGEEKFADRIEHPSYESLRNRMYLRSRLRPMSPAECEQYVKFRLLIAGRMADLFDAGAFAALHARSGGVCRNLSKLCMLTLLHGAMNGRTTIDEETVTSAAAMM